MRATKFRCSVVSGLAAVLGGVGLAQAADGQSDELARLALFGTGAPEGTVALFAHGLPKGTLQKGDAVALRIGERGVLRTQMNPVASWPDGSVKVALFAVGTPALAPGATQECVLVKSPAGAPESAPLDLAAALKGRSATITITPANGAPWTFDLLAAALAPGNRDRWHNGPLAVSTRVETVVPSNNVGVTSLRLVADIVVTKDGLLEADSRLANDIVMKAGGGPVDYGYKVTIDGTDVYTQSTARHIQYAAWVRRNGRAKEGAMPERPVARPDYDQLVKGGFTLPWDRSLPGSHFDFYIRKSIAEWKPRANEPYPAWGLCRAAGNVGGRQEIGYRTYANMQWIKTGAPEAQYLAQRHVEVALSRPQSFWDSEGASWMTVEDWPRFSTKGMSPAGTSRDKAEGFPKDQKPFASQQDNMTIDHAHNGDFYSVVALLSGRRHAFDGLAINASWQTMDAGRNHRPNPEAKHSTWLGKTPDYKTGIAWAPVVGGPQIRGFAWGLRDVALTAALLPDNYPNREYFSRNAQAWINSYGAMLPELKAERGELAGWVPHTFGKRRASGFMTSFVIFAIQDALNMDVAGPNGAAVIEYLAGYRINAFNSPDFNWRNAASGMGIHIGDGTNYFTRWSQSQAAHVAFGEDMDAKWSKAGEGDFERNGLVGLALLRDAPLPLDMRAKAANAMVLFRSERQVGRDSHPRIFPEAFFGPFENLNSLCPYGSTWRWDIPPVIRAGQAFKLADKTADGIVGLVITDGGLPRASKPEGTDAFVIVGQPAGNPFAITRGGGLKLVGQAPALPAKVEIYATVWDNDGKEHRGPTVAVAVEP